jgi:cytochrome c oxidase subunit 1
MSSITVKPNEAIGSHEPAEKLNYLTVDHSIKSWLLTGDHKRIGLMYLFSVTFFFLLGSIAAGLIRLELISPTGRMFENDTYNKLFSAHGIIMVFLFLIPAIPAVLGNFFVPLMIGARDLAFPRLNLLSYYVYMVGAIMVLVALLSGGVDAGWTFYTPYSVLSKSQVSLCLAGIFLAGFSSIMTGLNFIVTIHKMRAPGMTWDKLPLFIWAHYATSIVILLGTPVVAITLLMVILERAFGIGIYSPELGGDPLLFQHLFWFYSHPAVYIMLLPGMGIVSELFATFSRKRIFGYKFVAVSSLLIAALGFLVWGHHMFVATQSMYQNVVFSLLTTLVAIPSAIKVFNWTATMFKGEIWMKSPMVFALCWIGLFLIGGLTGLYCANLATDYHLTATYFIVAHFHYVMVGATTLAFLGGLHYWWPKMFGRMYNDTCGIISALLIFFGFHFTFIPQFAMGQLGMPRRYHNYYFAPEYQPYHLASTLGTVFLAAGFVLPVFYLTWSLKYGPKASKNPWHAQGLEWTADSPPVTTNFEEMPTNIPHAYDYDSDEERIRLGLAPLEHKPLTKIGEH